MSAICLVVDDSSVTRALIQRSIKLSGADVAEVVEAANGREALAVLAAKRIDLVLADLHMPEMGGAELIARMRADNGFRAIPVVIVSAEPSMARIEELCRIGASGYLQKPFTPESIRDLITPLLEKRHVAN